MEKGKARVGDGIFWMVSDQKDYLTKNWDGKEFKSSTKQGIY